MLAFTSPKLYKNPIADFIGLPYFSGFPSGLKSDVLISHDFLSLSKFVPLPRARAAMCSRPASKHQKKFCFVSKQPNFSDQFKNIVKRYIRVGYNLDIMRQSACLVLNPITVYSYGFLFNCTTVGHALDSMTALT